MASMDERSPAQAGSSPAPANLSSPRPGDLVSWVVATATAGPHTVTDERRGIVVAHDDNGKRAPAGYVMARSKGAEGNAWTTVAVERVTVEKRRESL